MSDELQPWFMPLESLEAVEIMTETAESIRNVAQYASLRKELRVQLLNAATRLEDFCKMVRHGIVDPSLMLGLDEMARDKKTTYLQEIMEALENHVSAHNRRRA